MNRVTPLRFTSADLRGGERREIRVEVVSKVAGAKLAVLCRRVKCAALDFEVTRKSLGSIADILIDGEINFSPSPRPPVR